LKSELLEVLWKKLHSQEGDEFDVPDPASVLGSTVALWLLAIIASFHAKNKLIVMEAGGVEALSDKLATYTSNPQVYPDLDILVAKSFSFSEYCFTFCFLWDELTRLVTSYSIN
jgi:hypothetical protein